MTDTARHGVAIYGGYGVTCSCGAVLDWPDGWSRTEKASRRLIAQHVGLPPFSDWPPRGMTDSPTPSEPRTTQPVDPLAIMVGEYARDFVHPKDRVEAIDRLYVLLREARADAAEPAALDVKRLTDAIRRAWQTNMLDNAPALLAARIANAYRSQAAEPAALDVERVKRAIFIVADNEEYDLQYTKEVHRLANDVAARLQSPDVTGDVSTEQEGR